MGISTSSPGDSAEVAQEKGIDFDLLSDTDRDVASAYGVADAGPELAMPALFIIRSDGVIHWRAVGESMSDLPPLETVLEAVAQARTAPAASP